MASEFFASCCLPEGGMPIEWALGSAHWAQFDPYYGQARYAAEAGGSGV